MGRSENLYMILLVAAVSLAVAPGPLLAQDQVIHVPGDQPTITAATAVAYPGDEIRVAAGVYHEPEIFLPAGVSLVGAGPHPQGTSLYPEGEHRVLTILGYDSRIEGMRIQSGAAVRGGCIAVTGGQITLRDLTISGGRANLGGGVFIESASVLLDRCHLVGNQAYTAGGGLYAFNATCVELRDSLLLENLAGGEQAGYGGGWYAARTELVLGGCTVVNNQAPRGREGASFHGEGVTVSNSLITDDTGLDRRSTVELQLLTDAPGRPQHTCSLRWAPGWTGYLADQLAEPASGNLEADPLFCGEPGTPLDRFGLAANSPALAGNNDCGLMGAFGQACGPTAAPDLPLAPCVLHPAAPNPFNPVTHIAFEIASRGPVKLAIYGLDGRRVATLVDEDRAAGRHTATWDGRDHRGRSVASGVYLARLVADRTQRSMRLTLVK